MRLSSIKMTFIVSVVMSAVAGGLTGCIPLHRHPATDPSTNPATNTSTNAAATELPTTEPTVAAGALGTVSTVPDVNPKPKPFIALPKAWVASSAKPSTLLFEHASPDSPVPLSDFARQPLHELDAFKLHKGMTADQVQQLMGLPAQVAGTDDPWLVYRLTGYRELWLHFIPSANAPADQVLDAADVVRSAEDGYVRDRVFSAE